ncbi:hypothetical protein EV361DRAFT_948355 [Lentinula raphanica]|nr:hypothetical protein C8R42DRAFT_661583 [Lentinula raphanica]KAJ3766165.1 hypothetical protein FB446DRAFT_410338 [Lentinula raphanica]KAJ3972946.1 hypothetical protein EV361DRAFT_948355 [Lentinula raphanica]
MNFPHAYGMPLLSVPIANSSGSSAPRGTPSTRNNSMPLNPSSGFEHQHYAELSRALSGSGRNSLIVMPVIGDPPQMDRDDSVRIARISLPGKGDLIIRFWASGEPQISFFGYFFDLLDLRLRPVRPPEGFIVYQSQDSLWGRVPTFERAFQTLLRNDPSTGPEKYFVPEGTRLQIFYRGQPVAALSAPVHPRHLNALGTSVQAPILHLRTVDQFGTDDSGVELY